ncbi:MAG: acyltransferase [Chitinophagaceae bacterium]|nr:acyltransferase [Chitinophagaceae bacterium]
MEIDGLRGVAAILVLISHYTWAYDRYFNLLEEHAFHFPYGDIGVEIFFIISGFVIFMTITKVKTIKEFFINRFSRLYPTYWLCMLITLCVITLLPVPKLGHYTVKEILTNLTMMSGLINVRYIDQVYWSLEIELFFYAIMAVIFYCRGLKDIDYIVIVWLLLSAVSVFMNFPGEKYVRKILILNWAPLFITGIAIYKVKLKEATILNHITILVAFIIYSYNVHEKYPFDIIPNILITIAYLVFYIYALKGMPFLKNRVLLFFGTISYALYLLHNVVGYAILYRIRDYIHNQFLYCIFTAFITTFLAYIVTKYFDNKVVRWTKAKLTAFLSKV